jgi:enoyl-CoA hydratase
MPTESSEQTSADPVILERSDGVAVLTLNRPRQHNAFNSEMAAQLAEYCEVIDADPSIGAVVLRGSEGTFCSGADRAVLKRASEDPTREDNFEELGATYKAFMRVGRLEPPVVAAVRGAAVGAGLNLFLAADLRIVADNARLLAGFLRIDIHPGGGHFALMGRLGGREATVAMSIFGEEIDGRRAVELGFAWQALPDDQVEPRAFELAARTARDPLLSRRANLSSRRLSTVHADWDVAMEAERSVQMWSLRRRATRSEPKS